MSGYNRLEQTVGTVLERFPRLKRVAERAYQRTNYHLFARNFEYDIHDDVRFASVEEWFDIETAKPPARFVGFYDIQPWSASMDQFLAHQLTPGPDPEASLVSLSDGSLRTLTKTDAWNYQQGSRLQYRPTEEGVLYNDIIDGTPGASLLTLDGDIQATFNRPISAVHPNQMEFLSVDYRRLDRNSPAYGYGTLSRDQTAADDRNSGLDAPESDGIFRVTESDETLLVSFESLLDRLDNLVPADNHYIHHLLYAPDGKRFVFLHRWLDGQKRNTRLYVASADGSIELLHENRFISHFCWLDTQTLFLWGGTAEHGRGYYSVDVTSGELSPVKALAGYGDGHPSVSPDGRWIVTDSYPNRKRQRNLHLYDRQTDRVIKLGSFSSPFSFEGATRCDLHPRFSPDGRFVSIDSAHTGTRQTYVLDISDIV